MMNNAGEQALETISSIRASFRYYDNGPDGDAPQQMATYIEEQIQSVQNLTKSIAEEAGAVVTGGGGGGVTTKGAEGTAPAAEEGSATKGEEVEGAAAEAPPSPASTTTTEMVTDFVNEKVSTAQDMMQRLSVEAGACVNLFLKNVDTIQHNRVVTFENNIEVLADMALGPIQDFTQNNSNKSQSGGEQQQQEEESQFQPQPQPPPQQLFQIINQAKNEEDRSEKDPPQQTQDDNNSNTDKRIDTTATTASTTNSKMDVLKDGAAQCGFEDGEKVEFAVGGFLTVLQKSENLPADQVTKITESLGSTAQQAMEKYQTIELVKTIPINPIKQVLKPRPPVGDIVMAIAKQIKRKNRDDKDAMHTEECLDILKKKNWMKEQQVLDFMKVFIAFVQTHYDIDISDILCLPPPPSEDDNNIKTKIQSLLPNKDKTDGADDSNNNTNNSESQEEEAEENQQAAQDNNVTVEQPDEKKAEPQGQEQEQIALENNKEEEEKKRED